MRQGDRPFSLQKTEGDRPSLFTNDSVYYLRNGHAPITDLSLAQTDKIEIKGLFKDGYSLKLSNWGGGKAQDTGIFYKGDLIGVVQDQNITKLNPNQVFLTVG